MITDEMNIKKILFNKFNLLGKLCRQSKQNNIINETFNTIIARLNPEITAHCRVTNIANNYLYIEASRSEYLTQLRFISADILSGMRQHDGLHQIIGIKFKVNPGLVQISDKPIVKSSNNNRKPYKPTQKAALSLETIATSIKNNKLKAALLKLSKINNTKN